MGQRTLVSSGVWVSPLEKRFRPTPLEAVRLRPGDVALVPLEAGRRLHAFELAFQDVRPRSRIIHGMYLDVNLLDARGDVLRAWKPRIDPQILHRSPDLDHACRWFSIIDVDVDAGWHMRFRPIFPAEGPAAEFIPVWNFVGYYLPDVSDAMSSGA